MTDRTEEGSFVRVSDLAYVIALGAGLGLASAHYAVAQRPPFGLVQVGSWLTWPRSGGRDIDPYLRAYLARGVHLPLGIGEGLELIAERDGQGEVLDGRCRYLISGPTPTTRGWTLGVVGRDAARAQPVDDGSTLSDAQIIREETGELRVTVSSLVQDGNWLLGPGPGAFRLRLALYDTPTSSQASELRATLLPRIERLDCP